MDMREASYYEVEGQAVHCRLCPKECVIGEGRTGFCRVRKNVGGKLYTQNYAACTAIALDPIEKKPLYHFYPGSSILSLGTWGCNFACRFCQNWQIAHEMPETKTITPQKAMELAIRYTEQGNIGIAYTYSEPGVWFEYVLDTAKKLREKGLKNVLVTNGFIGREPLKQLLPFIDGMNIDVKGFSNEYYREICAGTLEKVQETVALAAANCHVEITTLLVPGKNDRKEEITALAQWLAGIRPDIPLHFSRYFPNYKMQDPETPLSVMETAYQTAKNYLQYVYLGNLGGAGSETHCPGCGYLVIDRAKRYSCMTEEHSCPKCSYPIAVTGQISF
jgi:pyruvate formate lyase activating enzyme